MERRKFEDSFQDAFKDAEVNPSENVWTNIELDLEKAQGDKMKRRLFFFQTLAAASVVFAMCIAGVGYYVMNHDTPGNLAYQSIDTDASVNDSVVRGNDNSKTLLDTQVNESTSSGNENATAEAPSAKKDTDSFSSGSSDNVTAENERTKQRTSTSALSPNADGNAVSSAAVQDSGKQNSIAQSQGKSGTTKHSTPWIASDHTKANTTDVTKIKSSTDVESIHATAAASGESKGKSSTPDADETFAASRVKNGEAARKLPSLYELPSPELQLASPPTDMASTVDPGMRLLLERAEEERRWAQEDKKQAKDNSEKLWTSVGFAAGGFNANNPSVGGAPANAMYAMSSSQTATQQSKANGVSYSVGVGFGTKLSNRWILQGGLSYMTQSSDYTANSVVVVDNNYADPKAASLNAFAPQLADERADTKVAQTFPYNVNNNVRFMSVPLQAGYLLVNKKFGLQLNAGVATDLFLQNTITPDGAGLTKTTQGRGDESPYRSLNFSGLMGTEFSYRLGYHYRVSLNPGLRYPFSSVYKSSTGVDSTPVTFDVGLRFKYIFH